MENVSSESPGRDRRDGLPRRPDRSLQAALRVVRHRTWATASAELLREAFPGESIKAKGVDSIVCISVNDAFVMDSWGTDKNADEIQMVGDGNGEFTSAIGLEMDGSGFGLGTRSQRYAMIVEDGTVTKLAVEDPGQFEVSKAEAILAAL